MEKGPLTTPSFEHPTDGVDKKETKKKSAADAQVARSLDRLPLFEKPELPKKSEKLAAKLAPAKDEQVAPEKAEETPPPLESLSHDETRHVTQELAAGHLQELEELTEPEASEMIAVSEFLDKVATGQEVEAAFCETAAGLGLTETEITAALAESNHIDDLIENGDSAENDDDTAMAELLPPEDMSSEESEITIDHSSQEPTAEVGDGGNGQRGRGGRGAGGSPPPPPFGNDGSAFGSVEHHSGAGSDMIPLATARYYERRAQNNGLLLGGLIGYLIGRRRGRIKTEKRLLPVQKKLHREIKQLDTDLLDKELRLRRLSAERLKFQAVTKNNKSPLMERPQAGRHETRLGLEKPRSAERVGHLLVAAEAPATRHKLDSSDNPDRRPNNIRQALRPEEVKLMNRRELLEVSEKIIIEGASLRRIYESHLVGEQQLRHLVGEYLSGKDIRRILRREMVEREIDFERDPLLRDRARSQVSSNDTPLNQLLEKVGLLPSESVADERRQNERTERAVGRAVKQRRRQLVDAGMVTIIVILAVVVAVLLVR